MNYRFRILTAMFLILNLLMVTGVSASVAHLPDDHYAAHLSIVHSHADHDDLHADVDHDHQLHLHLLADLVRFSITLHTPAANAAESPASSQLVTLYYSPLLPPPNA